MQKNSRHSFSVSQNFLTSRRTIDSLIHKAGIGKTDDIIEIGAGKGHLTRALAIRAKQVRAYEIDPVLAQKCNLAGHSNVQLVCKDFLKAALPVHGMYKVFSNIPFSITTQIIKKLTGAENPPCEAYLIMEKGAALRFCGFPRENMQSLLLKPFFQLEILQDIPRREFHPMPKTEISMLKLVRRPIPDLPAAQRQSFCRFVQEAYQKGVFGKGACLTKKQAATALRLAGLPPLPASENLLYVQWLCLFRCYCKFYEGEAGQKNPERRNKQKKAVSYNEKKRKGN